MIKLGYQFVSSLFLVSLFYFFINPISENHRGLDWRCSGIIGVSRIDIAFCTWRDLFLKGLKFVPKFCRDAGNTLDHFDQTIRVGGYLLLNYLPFQFISLGVTKIEPIY